jgi:hypothetical protein
MQDAGKRFSMPGSVLEDDSGGDLGGTFSGASHAKPPLTLMIDQSHLSKCKRNDHNCSISDMLSNHLIASHHESGNSKPQTTINRVAEVR